MIKISQMTLSIFASLFFISGCNSDKQIKKVDKIELIQNFKPGAIFHFEVQRGNADSRQPGSEKIKSSTDVTFRVLAEKKGVKECSWTYGSTSMIGVSPDQIDEQTRTFLNIHQGIEVKFTVDNKGAVQEIINFGECKNYMENAFKKINENATNKMSQEEYDRALEFLRASYRTPEMLVNTYCPELAIFFTMYGQTVKADSIYRSKSELPNPFGGRSFPTKVITRLDSVKNDIAYISVKQTISPDDLNAIMKETMLKLSDKSGQPLNENEIPKMDVTAMTTFSYDFQKNILTEVYSEKHIDAGEIKQNRTLKVILKN